MKLLLLLDAVMSVGRSSGIDSAGLAKPIRCVTEWNANGADLYVHIRIAYIIR